MESYDAIVIGAGVIGSSVAYHLARFGAGRVLVLDRAQIGAGTTSQSSGILRTHYSVPYTVFGPMRAAVYVGQMYFVFNTKEHIRVLTRHFDDLVRAAVVQANDTPKMLAALRDEVVKAEKR